MSTPIIYVLSKNKKIMYTPVNPMLLYYIKVGAARCLNNMVSMLQKPVLIIN